MLRTVVGSAKYLKQCNSIVAALSLFTVCFMNLIYVAIPKNSTLVSVRSSENREKYFAFGFLYITRTFDTAGFLHEYNP